MRLLGFLHRLALRDAGSVELVDEADWRPLGDDPIFCAVRARSADVSRMLADESEGVRAAALSLFVNVPPLQAEALRSALADAKPLVRGLAVLALARWALWHGDSDVVEELPARFKKAKGVEKILAALAWLQLSPTPAAVNAVLSALPNKPRAIPNFTFADGNVFALALNLLAAAPAEATNEGADLLAAIREPLLAEVGGHDIAEAGIRALFSGRPTSQWWRTAPEDLTAPQRAFLELLVETPAWSAELNQLLSGSGIPVHASADDDGREELQRYLGTRPAHELTQRLAGRLGGEAVDWPLYKWVRAVLLGAATEADLTHALLQDDALTVIEAARTLSRWRYDLMLTGGYETERFVRLALAVLDARSVELTDTLLRQALAGDDVVVLVALSRRLANLQQDLPARFDDQLPRRLEAGPRALAVELVERLPAPRRDALIERWGFPIATMPSPGAVDGWSLAHLHSRPERALSLMIDGVRSYAYEYEVSGEATLQRRELAQEYWTIVRVAFAGLPVDAVAAMKEALRASTAPRAGDGLLRDLLASLERETVDAPRPHRSGGT